MDMGVCQNCIDDKHLKLEAVQNGEIVLCSECDREVQGLTAEYIGRRLEPLLRRYYVPGEEYRATEPDDDGTGHSAQRGEGLSEIIQDQLGNCYKCHDEIVGAVMDAENHNPFDGDHPYWDDHIQYEYNAAHHEPGNLPSWDQTKQELKHGRRFFSPSARAMFDGLFRDVDNIRSWTELGPQPVCYDLPPGSSLFRARVVDSVSDRVAVAANPSAQVGPPPPAIARSGRMNADGVSVLYASKAKETCIAEMRPAIGSKLATIKLETSRALRVLDFCLLERVLSNTSLFDPDYEEKMIRWGALRQLHQLVIEPIVPGKEADYLITQTMAEYLGHVYQRPFDGVIFRSAQDAGGINVVLFSRDPFDGDTENRFGVKYVDESLSFVRIQAVAVKAKELEIVKLGEKMFLVDTNDRNDRG